MLDLELQKVLFQKFENGVSFPLYDGIGDFSFPYGAFGYATTRGLNTKTSQGNKAYYQIDLFSDYNGQKEVRTMKHEVLSLLAMPFAVLEHEAFLEDWNFQVQREDSVYHGILEITINIY